MRLTPPTYLLLLGMTAVIGVLSAALAFAILRFLAANRETRRLRHSGTEMALLSAALEAAVTKLKAQQVATTARAEASEVLRHGVGLPVHAQRAGDLIPVVLKGPVADAGGGIGEDRAFHRRVELGLAGRRRHEIGDVDGAAGHPRDRA